MKKIYMALLASLLLCSCQKTPDEVKENMKQYGDNPQIEVSGITYCSLDELKESKLPEDTGSGISLPEKVDFSGIEAVELLHLTIEKDYLSDTNVNKYTELFGVAKDKMKPREAGDSSWGNSLYYDNEKQHRYLNIMENGGMSYLAGTSYDDSSVIEKVYNIDREDVSGVEVELADGKANLASICGKMERWLNKNMKTDGFSYKISDAFIRNRDKPDSGVKKLSFCAEYDHKGIRLNDHTPSLEEEKTDFGVKELTTFLAVQLDYEKAGIPSYFSRNLHIVVDSAEQVEKIVDPNSAVKILKENLSGFGVFHISEVLPLYALYLTDSGEAPGAGIEARPVYAFLVKKQAQDVGKDIIKMNYCEHFFYVDMITGELTTDLDIN